MPTQLILGGRRSRRLRDSVDPETMADANRAEQFEIHISLGTLSKMPSRSRFYEGEM